MVERKRMEKRYEGWGSQLCRAPEVVAERGMGRQDTTEQ